MKLNGIRLDSGDLAELSILARKLFQDISIQEGVEWIKDIKIGASNDINEKTLHNFNTQGHQMDVFGIGTNLVTCQAQPYMILNAKLNFSDRIRYSYRTITENKLTYELREEFIQNSEFLKTQLLFREDICDLKQNENILERKAELENNLELVRKYLLA